MRDYFLEIKSRFRGIWNLKSWRVRLRGVSKSKKRNILAIIILVLCMRLFFSSFFYQNAHAEKIKTNDNVPSEIIDPMNKIDKGIIDPEKNKSKKASYCDKASKKNSDKQEVEWKEKENRLKGMIGGHPIEKMIPYIVRRDEKTAAFLVAIARKESSWGEHAPSMAGRDCYNYWGYKGSYHLAMGYSCFDNPEQAIKVVGDKIDELIAKRIDTPARMVVWKCGSSCADDDPGAVASWIGTVDTYLRKLI